MMSKNQQGHHLKESNQLELETSQWLILLSTSHHLISLQLDLLHNILLDIWFQPINHLHINLVSNLRLMVLLAMDNLLLLTWLVNHHLMEPLHLPTELNHSIKCLLNMELLHLTTPMQQVLPAKWLPHILRAA